MAVIDNPPPQSRETAAFKQLIELGIALSAERNNDRLMERILLGAKDISRADGGTLYLRTDDDALSFAILRNDTLGTAMGGTTGKAITFPALPLIKDGKPNHNNIATHVALTGETISIDDAYDTTNFDFSGTKAFDQRTGYRSKSFLTVPLKNHTGEVTGVIQLINAFSPSGDGTIVPFPADIIPLIEALASQAAVALANQQLIQAQRALFDSFMRLMAGAVDAKSAYTGGHCQRVPVLTEMLAEAACNEENGVFANFNLTEDEWYELQIAGGLHDVGKVTTPVHIMDKATKLEKIVDRIETIRLRFEILKRDADILYWEKRTDGGNVATLDAERKATQATLDAEYAYIAEANIGGEFMADEKIARVKEISQRRWLLGGEEQPLLSEDEIMNLSIRRGTLNADDRKIINDHIVLTIQMLESLPFPKHLKRVPEIAGGHHEKMDGTGYPKGLKRHEMSLLARMMGIADIFEALTAADRPYKKPKTLSESLKIMAAMKRDQHIDPDLFELFLRSGVYKKYAERFLLPEQMDEVEIESYM